MDRIPPQISPLPMSPLTKKNNKAYIPPPHATGTQSLLPPSKLEFPTPAVDENAEGNRVIGCSLRLRSRKIAVLGYHSRKASRSAPISRPKKCATRASAMTSRSAHGIYSWWISQYEAMVTCAYTKARRAGEERTS